MSPESEISVKLLCIICLCVQGFPAFLIGFGNLKLDECPMYYMSGSVWLLSYGMSSIGSAVIFLISLCTCEDIGKYIVPLLSILGLVSLGAMLNDMYVEYLHDCGGSVMQALTAYHYMYMVFYFILLCVFGKGAYSRRTRSVSPLMSIVVNKPLK